MTDWITAILVGASSLIMLVVAFGIARMPDVYSRLQVTTKSSILGASLVLLAVGTYFTTVPTFTRALLGIGFLVLTQPIAAHMIGRAAYLGNVEKWERTLVDDLEGSTRMDDGLTSTIITTGEILEALERDEPDSVSEEDTLATAP